jgi:hypothetical protein
VPRAPGITQTDGVVNSICAEITKQINLFTLHVKVAASLDGRERQRLYGAGVKNYGLIEAAYDIARDNPSFIPPFITPEKMNDDILKLEESRQLLAELEQFTNIVSQFVLIYGDRCYRNALFVYDNLKMLAKRRTPGAAVLYEALSGFFKSRGKRGGNAEPTAKEIQRDVRKLLHNKADGEIVIKNERPRAAGRKREVIDDVGKTGQ